MVGGVSAYMHTDRSISAAIPLSILKQLQIIECITSRVRKRDFNDLNGSWLHVSSGGRAGRDHARPVKIGLGSLVNIY